MIPFLFQSEYIVPLIDPNGLEVDVLVVLVVVVEVLVVAGVVVVVDIIVV